MDKGQLAGVAVDINWGDPTILNFGLLDRLVGDQRRISPVSPLSQPFIYFTERELLPLLWRSDNLKKWFRDITKKDHWVLPDMMGWLMGKEPGFLISRLLTTVGNGERKVPGVKSNSYQRSTVTWSLESTRRHLQEIRAKNFDVPGYSEKGYVLRGGISTDGFRLQLTAHKIKELQSVRFRRLPIESIPSPLTSTVGGTSHYLKEVRNVIRTQDDVKALWSCDPGDIKILGLDLGQAYVVGASAILPGYKPASSSKVTTISLPVTGDPAVATSSSAHPAQSTSSSPAAPTFFHNLSVNQKAVYQPVFKFRHWLGHAKEAVPEGHDRPLEEIESGMPSLRGQNADYQSYAAYLEEHHDQIQEFYGTKFLSHQWDCKRAKEAEYAAITDQLLRMVGGSIGEKRKDSNNVVIGIGLGQFKSTRNLSSLHGSLLAFFLNKVSTVRTLKRVRSVADHTNSSPVYYRCVRLATLCWA